MREDLQKKVRSLPTKQPRKQEVKSEKPTAGDVLAGRNAVSEALKGQRP